MARSHRRTRSGPIANPSSHGCQRRQPGGIIIGLFSPPRSPRSYRQSPPPGPGNREQKPAPGCVRWQGKRMRRFRGRLPPHRAESSIPASPPPRRGSSHREKKPERRSRIRADHDPLSRTRRDLHDIDRIHVLRCFACRGPASGLPSIATAMPCPSGVNAIAWLAHENRSAAADHVNHVGHQART